MEGNDAEAARLAVAKGLDVKLIIDDNDVTITGHPSQYLQGYDLAKTLGGQGLGVAEVDGEVREGVGGERGENLATPARGGVDHCPPLAALIPPRGE